MLGRIPFVKSVYSSVKQVSDTLLSDSGNAFRKALLVEFPCPGSWTIAFQTGTPAPEVAAQLAGEHISVYVPTTPNPTSGYFIVVPVARVHELEMTVDEALKYIISMGVVAPKVHPAVSARRAARFAQQRSTTEIDRAGVRRAPPIAARACVALPLKQPNLDPRRTAAMTDFPENILKRTDYCGRIDRKRLGQIVTVCGWVHRRRDHGGVIFIDLRDREGLVQIVCDPDRAATFAVGGDAAQRVRDRGIGPRAPAPRGYRQHQPRQWRDRNPGARSSRYSTLR